MLHFIFWYLCIFVVVVSVPTFIFIHYLFKKKRFHLDQIVNFSSYYAVLEYHMLRAYEIIYKDRILIYSIESVRLNGKEFHEAAKSFAYLVIRMIGSQLKEEFISLYGNEDTFLFILTEYFNKKYEEDEIRKASVAEMQLEE